MKGGVMKWKCSSPIYYKDEANTRLTICSYKEDEANGGVAGSSCREATQAEIDVYNGDVEQQAADEETSSKMGMIIGIVAAVIVIIVIAIVVNKMCCGKGSDNEGGEEEERASLLNPGK